jgi:hypothetical protein
MSVYGVYFGPPRDGLQDRFKHFEAESAIQAALAKPGRRK